MKAKLLLFLLTTTLFIGCTEKQTKKIDDQKIQGLYEVTKLADKSYKGYWVFTDDEISYFDNLTTGDDHVSLVVVWKYYFDGNALYTCICNSEDCNDKKNFSSVWTMLSNINNKTNQTIIFKNEADKKLNVKLVKTKSEGLDVKDWE